MAHHILYIPGFGDQNPKTHIKILERWNKYGVETHFVPINWTDDELFEAKIERITKTIDGLAGSENIISLVGVSAGGSMALNAYAARKNVISGAVFICAKLRNPEGVNESYFRKQPAFKKSVFSAQSNIANLTDTDKTKMLTISSLYDGLIPAHDSRLEGVKSRTLPMILHVPTIFFAITLFKKITINFLKSGTE